jgi:hypothetical protein
MRGSVSGDEARGVRGFLRRSLHALGLTAEMRRVMSRGGALASLVLLASLALVACGAGDGKPVASDPSPAQSTQQTALPQETAPPAAENPTPVGQAVDAIAALAITDVLGEPRLTSAPEVMALIVSLAYLAPNAAVKGDGTRLHDAFISRGAAIDPDHADVESHGDVERFIVRYDTGDPAFQTVRVEVTPGSPDVYVNADKSE